MCGLHKKPGGQKAQTQMKYHRRLRQSFDQIAHPIWKLLHQMVHDKSKNDQSLFGQCYSGMLILILNTWYLIQS